MSIEVHLPRAQRRLLLRVTRKSRCALEVQRARIMLLLHEAVPVAEVARMVGCVRATVYRTVYRYEELGEESIRRTTIPSSDSGSSCMTMSPAIIATATSTRSSPPFEGFSMWHNHFQEPRFQQPGSQPECLR